MTLTDYLAGLEGLPECEQVTKAREGVRYKDSFPCGDCDPCDERLAAFPVLLGMVKAAIAHNADPDRHSGPCDSYGVCDACASYVEAIGGIGERMSSHLPKEPPQHVCGLQGFGALGDVCEACKEPAS